MVSTALANTNTALVQELAQVKGERNTARNERDQARGQVVALQGELAQEKGKVATARNCMVEGLASTQGVMGG